MITPLHEDLSVDQDAVARILDSFIEAGVAPFVLGTTGESVSLSGEQKAAVVKSMTARVDQNIPTYAGVAGNCLSESIDQAKRYSDMGVTAVVAHLPFYYPLSESQMMRYFEQLADGSPRPLILYNMPITVKQSIPVETIDRLSHHPNIMGAKDSERGLERIDQSLSLWSKRGDFAYYLGWAAQSAYAVRKGADGIVPSTGNLTPKLYRELYEAAAKGDESESDRLQQLTNRISEIYQKDKNLSQSLPALKVMMSVFGLCKKYVMPPLYDMEKEEQAKIEETIIKEALLVKEISLAGNSL